MTSYGVIPLHDIVAFPKMMFPLWVGREKSIAALQHASANTQRIVLVSQRTLLLEQPPVENLASMGTLCELMGVTASNDGHKALFRCLERFQIHHFIATEPFIQIDGKTVVEVVDSRADGESKIAQAKADFEKLVRRFGLEPDLPMVVENVDDPGQLADLLASYFLRSPNPEDDNSIEAAEHDWPWQQKRQQVLEILEPWQRLEHVLQLLAA